MDKWYEKNNISSTKQVVERGLINQNVAFELTKFPGALKQELWGVIFIELKDNEVIRWKGNGTYFNVEVGARQYIGDFIKMYGDV